MINILFFARLREQLSTDSLTMLPKENFTVHDILQHLSAKNSLWAKVLNDDSVLVAVNQEIVNRAHPVNSGDEVAFFPPVTGG